jgi:hypothetical protein
VKQQAPGLVHDQDRRRAELQHSKKLVLKLGSLNFESDTAVGRSREVSTHMISPDDIMTLSSAPEAANEIVTRKGLRVRIVAFGAVQRCRGFWQPESRLEQA